MRKRIIDIVEKIAAGCFLGAIFQRQEHFAAAVFWGVGCLVACLVMQWRLDKGGAQ